MSDTPSPSGHTAGAPRLVLQAAERALGGWRAQAGIGVRRPDREEQGRECPAQDVKCGLPDMTWIMANALSAFFCGNWHIPEAGSGGVFPGCSRPKEATMIELISIVASLALSDPDPRSR